MTTRHMPVNGGSLAWAQKLAAVQPTRNITDLDQWGGVSSRYLRPRLRSALGLEVAAARRQPGTGKSTMAIRDKHRSSR